MSGRCGYCGYYHEVGCPMRDAVAALGVEQTPAVDHPVTLGPPAEIVDAAPPDPRRANWIGAPEYFLLNQACLVLNAAFGWGSTYLVGSALTRRDYRDVDIRTILDDDVFERLFPGASKTGGGLYQLNALWSLMCSSVSLLLSQQSGLKVDFQIQQRTHANEQFSNKLGHHRHPIGLFVEQ